MPSSESFHLHGVRHHYHHCRCCCCRCCCYSSLIFFFLLPSFALPAQIIFFVRSLPLQHSSNANFEQCTSRNLIHPDFFCHGVCSFFLAKTRRTFVLRNLHGAIQNAIIIKIIIWSVRMLSRCSHCVMSSIRFADDEKFGEIVILNPGKRCVHFMLFHLSVQFFFRSSSSSSVLFTFCTVFFSLSLSVLLFCERSVHTHPYTVMQCSLNNHVFVWIIFSTLSNCEQAKERTRPNEKKSNNSNEKKNGHTLTKYWWNEMG